MGEDVNVNFALTADEQAVVAKFNNVDGSIDKATASAKDLAREARTAETALTRLSSAVNFHGSRSTGQIASEMLGRADPQLGKRLAGIDRMRASQQVGAGSLRAEGERILKLLRAEPERAARATENEERFKSRLPTDRRKSGAIQRRITSFIRDNDLGTVDDPDVRHAARVLMTRVQRAKRVAVQSLREAGGNTDLIRLARAEGVPVERPLAVRDFVMQRSAKLANRDRIAQAFAEGDQAALAIAGSPKLLARARAAGVNVSNPAAVNEFVEQRRSARASRTRAGELALNEGDAAAAQEALRDANRKRIARAFALNDEEVRRVAKRPEVLAAARFNGVNTQSPVAIQAFRDQLASGLRRQLTERRDATRLTSGEREADAARDAQTLANRDRITKVFADRDAAVDRQITRSNRVAVRDRIVREESFGASELQESRRVGADGRVRDGYRRNDRGEDGSTIVDRRDERDLGSRNGDPNGRLARSTRRRGFRRIASAVDAAMPAVVGAAGMGVAAIYAGNELAGGYSERVGADYFESLKAIEPRYRALMGLEDNADRQRPMREGTRNKALAYGLETGVTAAAIYDILSSAGNLNADERKNLIGSSFRLQTVAGGDLPTLSQGLVSFSNIYGKQAGSIERQAALFKASADYGKFSTTTLASLGPDALSFFAMNGVGPEEALATLSVGSLKTGRPENFFTGMKYVASNMDKAVELGWTRKDAPWSQKLADLRGRSKDELESVFLREGVTAIYNTVQDAPQVERVTQMFKKIDAKDLRRQEISLLQDPLNNFSRLAQSVDVAGNQGFELLMDAGGPGGFDLAGNALKQKLAMEGQKLDNPVIASLTDKTKWISLEKNKDRYADMLLPHMLQAFAGEGEAGSLKAQALKLSLGKVKLGYVEPMSWNGAKVAFSTAADGRTATGLDYTRESTGADAADYLKLVKDERIVGMSAEEYGRYKTMQDNPAMGGNAQGFLGELKAKYANRDANAPRRDLENEAAIESRAQQLLAGSGDKEWQAAFKPIEDFVNQTKQISGDDSFRAKAAEQQQGKVIRVAAGFENRKKNYHFAAPANDPEIQWALRGFGAGVDQAEGAMLSTALNEEFSARKNLLAQTDPKSTGYERAKARFDEADKDKKAAEKDGIVSLDEQRELASKWEVKGATPKDALDKVVTIEDASLKKLGETITNALIAAQNKTPGANTGLPPVKTGSVGGSALPANK